MTNVLIGVLAAIVGAGLGYWWKTTSTKQKVDNAEQEADKILAKAKEKLAQALGMEDFIQKTDDLEVIVRKAREIIERK